MERDCADIPHRVNRTHAESVVAIGQSRVDLRARTGRKRSPIEATLEARGSVSVMAGPNVKLAVVTLVGVAGGVDVRIEALGAVRSMTQLKLAGDGSTLPDESIARTSKV